MSFCEEAICESGSAALLFKIERIRVSSVCDDEGELCGGWNGGKVILLFAALE